MSEKFDNQTPSRIVRMSIQYYGLITDDEATMTRAVGSASSEVRDLTYIISMSSDRRKILPGCCAAGRIELKVRLADIPAMPIIGRWFGLEARTAHTDGTGYMTFCPVGDFLCVDLEYVDGSDWIKLIGVDAGGLADGDDYIPNQTSYTLEDLLWNLNILITGDRTYGTGCIGLLAEGGRYDNTIRNYNISSDLLHGYSRRELSGFLAGLLGGYAMAQAGVRYGGRAVVYTYGFDVMVLRKWATNTCTITEDMIFRNGLQVESEQAVSYQPSLYVDENPSSNGDYTNPLIRDDTVADLTALTDTLTYVPGEIKLRGDPRITIGDVLIVPLPAGGTARMLACETELRYDGGLVTTVRCYGNEPLDKSKQGSLAGSLRRMRGALKAREVQNA